jgi:hypothetical protein
MLAERVAAIDIGLFDYVETQTSVDDRRSLLALHNAVAARSGSFSYLEIGSHLGGTLQIVIADRRCARVVSIDPRPRWQPDDRPEVGRYEYPDNSTDRMVELLAAVPDADLAKLETVEASTDRLSPARFAPPDLCLIDGEHTYAAALRDARFCRAVTRGAGIVAFHDFHVVAPAVLDFLAETPPPRRGYLLASSVFVVELGAGPTVRDDRAVRGQLRPRREWMLAGGLGAAASMIHSSRWRTGASGT